MFSFKCFDEFKIKYVKVRLIYSVLFENKIEALFIKFWSCFFFNRKIFKIEYVFLLESYEGIFVGIKEKDIF